MHGLKTTFWLATALFWGFRGWEITPTVFATNADDGFMVGCALSCMVMFCLGRALEHLEKAVRA